MTAPDPFFDPDAPPLVESVNQVLPKSEGGLIEAVKRAVIGALRETLVGSSLRYEGRPVYVDLEYPLEPTQYPGIWVQFSPTKLQRAGIGPVEIARRLGVSRMTVWRKLKAVGA